MAARYNRRSGSNNAAFEDVRPRTWVNTDRDLDVFNKTARPSSIKASENASRDQHASSLLPHQTGCEGSRIAGPKTMIPTSSTKPATKPLTTKPTRQSSKSIQVCKDIALSTKDASAWFVPPPTPTFGPFSKQRQAHQGRGPATEHYHDGTSRPLHGTEPPRPLKHAARDTLVVPSGRHLSFIAGTTTSDILLSSDVVSTVKKRRHPSFPTPNPFICSDAGATDTLHLFREQGEQHASDTICTTRYGRNDNRDANHDNESSLRLAIEEQENEMLMLALTLSLQDVTASSMDSEWRMAKVDNDGW